MDKSRDPPKDHNKDKVQLPWNLKKGIYHRGGASQIGAPNTKKESNYDAE